MTGFHIDSQGNLKPCIMATDITFNLSQGSFSKGWHDVIPGIREKKAGNASACNQCEKRHLCGFCPAFFKLENGGRGSLFPIPLLHRQISFYAE